MEVAESYKSSTVTSDAEDRSPKLKVLHANDSHSQNVVNYKLFHLLEKLQTYNEKMAVRAGTYATRMETLMKTYRFDGNDLITILRFLAQFERARDSNRVSEDTTLWNVTAFMKDVPTSCLTVRMTPSKEDAATHRLPKTSEERISTYVKAGNFLLKSYATDFNIAEATPDIACL